MLILSLSLFYFYLTLYSTWKFIQKVSSYTVSPDTQRPSYRHSFPDQVLRVQNHWSLLQKHFLPPAPRVLHIHCLNSILETVISKRKNQNLSYINFAILCDPLEFLIHA